MKLTLAEPRYLKDSVAVISELVNEVRLKIGKNAIELLAMDPANVAMIDFKLLASAFVEYNVKEKKEICVSMESLKSVLKRAKPSDTITLELDDEKNRLNIALRGDSNRDFSLALINIEEAEQKIPNLEFPIKVETNSLVFNEAIEDMDIIADAVTMVADTNKLIIQAKGNLHSGKVELAKGGEMSITTKTSDTIKARYSLEYLKKIIKGNKLTGNMVLQFGKDYPMRVEYKIKDKLVLSTILAPRVSNE